MCEATEKFIAYIREYPILYDATSREYLNSKKKELIWEEIGRKLNMSGTTAKRKFKNMKDAFRKSKKEQETRSGQAATGKTKAYKYAKLLEFLEPHMVLRSTISNLSQVPSGSGEDPMNSRSESGDGQTVHVNSEGGDVRPEGSSGERRLRNKPEATNIRKRRVLDALQELKEHCETRRLKKIMRREENERDLRRAHARSILAGYKHLSDARFMETKNKIQAVIDEALKEQFSSDEEN